MHLAFYSPPKFLGLMKPWCG